MRSFFDSSTLISALVESEQNHAEAGRAFDDAKDRVASAHSIAECFAILTGRFRFSPNHADELIREGLPEIEWVPLPSDKALAVVRDAHRQGFRGGLIYDAMILAVARHVKADVIYTGNRGDFVLCAPDLAARICEP